MAWCCRRGWQMVQQCVSSDVETLVTLLICSHISHFILHCLNDVVCEIFFSTIWIPLINGWSVIITNKQWRVCDLFRALSRYGSIYKSQDKMRVFKISLTHTHSCTHFSKCYTNGWNNQYLLAVIFRLIGISWSYWCLSFWVMLLLLEFSRSNE